MSLIDYKFIHHVARFGLDFKTFEEYQLRKAVFEETDAFILEENAKPENTYTVGHNKFSTWTEEERATLTGTKPDRHPESRTYWTPPFGVEAPPPSVNWISQGCVTSVMDQGQCSSDWAFSAAGALEGAHCVKSG